MRTEEIIEKISKQIQWYYENSERANLDKLIRFRDLLAWNAFFLAEVTADTAKDYNCAVFQRRIKYAQTISQKKAEKIEDRFMTDKMADAAATQAVEQEMLEELENQANAHKCELILKQTNSVLDAVSQRVSFLKQESKKADDTSSVPATVSDAEEIF